MDSVVWSEDLDIFLELLADFVKILSDWRERERSCETEVPMSLSAREEVKERTSFSRGGSQSGRSAGKILFLLKSPEASEKFAREREDTSLEDWSWSLGVESLFERIILLWGDTLCQDSTEVITTLDWAGGQGSPQTDCH